MADSFPLAAALAAAHPGQAANLLEPFEADECATLIAALDPGTAAAVLLEMAPVRAAACLAAVPSDASLAALRQMTPRGAATVLRSVPEDRREAWLTAMSRARRLQIALVLRYPVQTVGAWMDSAVLKLGLETTAASARNRLVRESRAPARLPARLYVTDSERRLIGWVAVQAVLGASDEAAIGTLYTAGGPSVRASAALDSAADDPGWQEFDELPVVDRSMVLVGTIRFAALRRAMVHARETARTPDSAGTGTIMDIADLCYLGMAQAIDTSIARRRFDTPARREDAS